jgi:hypothetical protein
MRVLGMATLLLTMSPLFGEPGLSSPIVGIGTGQTARLTALNLGSRQSTATSTCQITAQFLDQKATILKEKTFEVPAGKSESIDFDYDRAKAFKGLQLRAVLLFGQVGGGAQPGPDARHTFDCNIVPSLELYDKPTGRTSVILTDWKPLPIPDPRAVAFTPPATPRQ